MLLVGTASTERGVATAPTQRMLSGMAPFQRFLKREIKKKHPGSDQYEKYNCLILVDNPSVYDLFPSLEHAFYYQKRHCKKCHLLNMIFFAVKNLF